MKQQQHVVQVIKHSEVELDDISTAFLLEDTGEPNREAAIKLLSSFYDKPLQPWDILHVYTLQRVESSLAGQAKGEMRFARPYPKLANSVYTTIRKRHKSEWSTGNILTVLITDAAGMSLGIFVVTIETNTLVLAFVALMVKDGRKIFPQISHSHLFLNARANQRPSFVISFFSFILGEIPMLKEPEGQELTLLIVVLAELSATTFGIKRALIHEILTKHVHVREVPARAIAYVKDMTAPVFKQILKKFEKGGWIQGHLKDKERYYQITLAGREYLNQVYDPVQLALFKQNLEDDLDKAYFNKTGE